MINLPLRFVLFDTEYTAWGKSETGGRREGSSEHGEWGPGQYKEIIQIGAIIVSGKTLTEEASFSVLVKPVKNPILSDFITELTGITQEIIEEKGVSLSDALSAFESFANGLPLYAYGEDGVVLKDNCKLLQITFPFSQERFFNVRELLLPLLHTLNIDPTAYTSGTLLEAFGKKGERAHDAVNDMRNLLAALEEIRSRS